MNNQKTQHLSLPLPHPDNDLADDVERLRTAFGLLDADAGAQATALEAAKTAVATADGKAFAAQITADAAQTTATKAVQAAATAQSTADIASTKAQTAIDKPSTRALGAPTVRVWEFLATGHAAKVELEASAIKLPGANITGFSVSVDGGTPVEVVALNDKGMYSLTPTAVAGTVVRFFVTAIDSLGNRSPAGTGQATLVDAAIGQAVLTSPAQLEQYVSLTPTITLAPMHVVGAVEDTASFVRVQIATDDTFTSIVFDTGATYPATTTIPVTVALSRDTKHFARAMWTGVVFGAGPWSEVRSFTTLPALIIRACQNTEGVPGKTWQRIDVAGNALTVNPAFDTHPIYAGIVEQVIDGQRMIGFPKCFVSRETLATGAFVGKDARGLSDVALPGYEVHPAFLAHNDTTADDMIWIGKYQACDDGGNKAGSKHGTTPLVSIDFPTMQTRCTNRNAGGVAGFHMWNVHELSLVQLMMLLEFGGTDMQTLVGRGHVDNAPSGVQAVDHPTVLQASWRGLTGIWGNIYQMCDGFRGGQNTGKMRLDMGKGFVDTTIPACNTSFNPNKILNASGANWNARHMFVGDFASNAASVDAAAYPDTQWLYANSTSSEYVLYAGGNCSNGSSAGLFFFGMSSDPTNGYSIIGSRLAKR